MSPSPAKLTRTVTLATGLDMVFACYKPVQPPAPTLEALLAEEAAAQQCGNGAIQASGSTA
jgi:hypothetical protein